MDAQELASTAWAFIVSLVQGIPRGEPLSVLAVVLVALGVCRLVLTKWAWYTVKSLTLIGLFGYYMYLASNVVAERLGHDASLYMRGAVAALCGVFVVMAGLHLLHERRDSRPATRAGLAMRPARADYAYATGAGGGYSYAGAGAPHTTKLVRRAGNTFMGVFQPGKDQKLITILAFTFIAEFGVFSTGIVWPPKAWAVGLGFFLILLAGCVVYIATTYEKKARGLVYFAITSVIAIVVALLFETLWYQTPVEQALSVQYFFTSTGIIAASTGIGFSMVVQGHG